MRFISRSLLVLSLLGALGAVSMLAGPGVLAGASAPSPSAVSRSAVVPSAAHIVNFPVNGFNYSPADLTIFVGDEVEWSGPFASHPLVSDDNLWQVVNTGDSFRFTFTQPGDYRYHCQIHGGPGGVGMSGIVLVVAARRTYLPAVMK